MGENLHEIQYRAVLNPRIAISPDEFKRCVAALTGLEDFSLTGQDEDAETLEYRHRAGGKTLCKLQVGKQGVGAETPPEGVARETWDKWMADILGVIGSALNWTGKSLAILAVIHEHRFPMKGNNYEFLRDAFLKDSQLSVLLHDLKLLDMEWKARGELATGIQLMSEVSSNQTASEIRDGVLDDEDNRIIVRLHAVRSDVRDQRDVLALALEQQNALDEWLGSGPLAAFESLFTS